MTKVLSLLCSWSGYLLYYISRRHILASPKPIKWHVRPAKTLISLGIRPVWSESSLCVQFVAKDPSFLHADSEDSNQTGRMPRLIWVCAGRTCHIVNFVVRWLNLSLARPIQSFIFCIVMIEISWWILQFINISSLILQFYISACVLCLIMIIPSENIGRAWEFQTLFEYNTIAKCTCPYV